MMRFEDLSNNEPSVKAEMLTPELAFRLVEKRVLARRPSFSYVEASPETINEYEASVALEKAALEVLRRIVKE